MAEMPARAQGKDGDRKPGVGPGEYAVLQVIPAGWIQSLGT
jgi:hypothetical protein